jgi:hypothetical protein
VSRTVNPQPYANRTGPYTVRSTPTAVRTVSPLYRGDRTVQRSLPGKDKNDGLPLFTDYIMPEPPDLQQLVEAYGGYSRIPEGAWKLYGMRLAYTQAWLRYHHKKERPKTRAISRKKRPKP